MKFSIDACIATSLAPVLGTYSATFVARSNTGATKTTLGSVSPINGTPRAGDVTCPSSTHLSFPSDSLYGTPYTTGGAIGIILTK